MAILPSFLSINIMATVPKVATAFLNLKIETTNGSKKLSDYGIPLYADNPVHAKIMQLIEAGMSPNDFKQFLDINYKVNSKTVDSDTIEFGFAPKAE